MILGFADEPLALGVGDGAATADGGENLGILAAGGLFAELPIEFGDLFVVGFGELFDKSAELFRDVTDIDPIRDNGANGGHIGRTPALQDAAGFEVGEVGFIRRNVEQGVVQEERLRKRGGRYRGGCGLRRVRAGGGVGGEGGEEVASLDLHEAGFDQLVFGDDAEVVDILDAETLEGDERNMGVGDAVLGQQLEELGLVVGGGGRIGRGGRSIGNGADDFFFRHL